MLRSMLVGAALLAASAPAHAQVRDELSSGSWTCRMTALNGDPGMDTNLTFGPDGSLVGWFYMEVPDGADVIGLEFSVTGTWTLQDDVIASNVSGSELLAGSYNGEPFSEDALAEMAADVGDALASFSGESQIAYIAPHAMVLDEPDASISCWR